MLKKILFIAGFLLTVIPVCFSQGKWELKKSQNGIEIYTRTPLSGNLQEMRVVCELNATKAQLIKVLQDIKHYDSWVYSSRQSSLLKVINQRQLIYYSVAHLPWPIKDRDLVVELSVLPDTAANRFQIQAKSLPEYIPQNPDFIRVPYSLALWRVTVVNEHTLKVDYTFSFNPGGSIPAWVVNSTLVVGPYNSFLNLKSILKNPPAN